jgi:mannose-6-phosphate isomerase-like protein (cupin superfamily)
MNKAEIINKIWGHEVVIWNGDYCGKKLVLNKGFCCSLHSHHEKDEVFYVIRGKVLMETMEEGQESKKEIMNPDDSIHIPVGLYHRFTGLTDAQIIEFSTHHEDSDSYRLDPSGKSNLFKAYDYDGVITKGIKPDSYSPIITSRTIDEVDKIDEETRKNHPIYFNPIGLNEKSLDKEVEWKAKMINLLGVEEFYENNVEVVSRLLSLCPKCHIVNVGENL